MIRGRAWSGCDDESGVTMTRDTGPGPPAGSGSAGQVLVVEDDVLVQRALLRLLRTAGYEPLAFSDADELFAGPLPEEPACLVLDLHLPRGHGIEILDRLSEMGESLPTIVLTGHADVPSAVRSMKRGAIELLEKPFDQKTLLAAVALGSQQALELAARRRQRREIAERLQALTPRESEVFGLVVAGWANKRIAGRLGISEPTVKAHRGRVMEKMEASSLADLVRMAITAGAQRQERS